MMQDVKQRVALSSIVASAGLTVAKAIVGVLSGSLAILSEAAHSLIDLGATVMTYYAVRVSGKPADAEHHYGHGKVESVSALAETALLFGLAGVVIWEAAKRLLSAEPPHVEATPWAFAVMLLSIVVDFYRARALNRIAKQTSSEALEADALHFSSDMWSSLAVVMARRHHPRLCLGRLDGGDSCLGRHLHCGLAARPPHHRHADGYRPGWRGRQNHRRRDAHSQRSRDRTVARAPGR
jgi:divalent metal cation (Fe/Co/Zn/Cd) transporter